MMKLRLIDVTAAILFAALTLKAAPAVAQRTFSTPAEAVHAAIEAAERNDSAALLELFGPGGKDIVESGDPSDDKENRAEFARAAHVRLQLDEESQSPNRVTFSVGEQDWPFPVPLVRKDGKWRLDSQAGRMEILARRVGRNELNAIEACRGYVEAQLDYSAASHDGDGMLKYAQKVFSTPGKQDGLYLGDSPNSLVSRAFADAATANLSTGGKPAEPYHGYYFRVLKSQGPDASGGAFEYLVDSRMIGGFALVAWPADYGISGIRTMIINHDGLVYEKDLGSATSAQARLIVRFNPDRSWRPVVLE